MGFLSGALGGLIPTLGNKVGYGGLMGILGGIGGDGGAMTQQPAPVPQPPPLAPGGGIGGGLPPGMGGPPAGMANPMSGGMGSITDAELGAMQGAFGGNPQFLAQLQALMAQQGPGAATPMRAPPQMPPFNPTAEPQRGRSSGGILDRIKSRMV